MEHIAANGYCRESFSAHKASNDDHIHHVIDGLQQVGAEQRKRKNQKKPGDAALGEIPNQ